MDPQTRAELERLQTAVALLQGKLSGMQGGLQSGTTTLNAGSSPAIPATISATSRILVTMKNPGGGAITGLGAFDTGSARVNGLNGTGSFVIRAIDDAKAVIGTAVCDVDWFVID